MERTDTNPVKSKRDLAKERMQGRYPDMNFDDDDVFFGRINDDFDDYDKRIAEYKQREKTFSDMFSSDPRSAAFLMNWRDGEDPAVGLVRQFGTEIKEAIDDPERQEQIAAANKEYVERVAKEKEYEEMYTKNLDASLAYLDQLQRETGMTDEEIDKVMQFVVSIVRDGVLGKFSPETIEMARKALNHDADVTRANLEGEVKGRNEKIEEKLRKSKKGDGTAALDGKNSSARRTTVPNLGALSQYGDDNLTIWERGKEKRTKINN